MGEENKKSSIFRSFLLPPSKIYCRKGLKLFSFLTTNYRRITMGELTSSELLTRKEAAKYLRICKSTLDKLPIPRIKIRHLVFYRKCDIDKWLAEKIRYGSVSATLRIHDGRVVDVTHSTTQSTREQENQK
jgi:hypothetical protein